MSATIRSARAKRVVIDFPLFGQRRPDRDTVVPGASHAPLSVGSSFRARAAHTTRSAPATHASGLIEAVGGDTEFGDGARAANDSRFAVVGLNTVAELMSTDRSDGREMVPSLETRAEHGDDRQGSPRCCDFGEHRGGSGRSHSRDVVAVDQRHEFGGCPVDEGDQVARLTFSVLTVISLAPTCSPDGDTADSVRSHTPVSRAIVRFGTIASLMDRRRRHVTRRSLIPSR